MTVVELSVSYIVFYSLVAIYSQETAVSLNKLEIKKNKNVLVLCFYTQNVNGHSLTISPEHLRLPCPLFFVIIC